MTLIFISMMDGQVLLNPGWFQVLGDPICPHSCPVQLPTCPGRSISVLNLAHPCDLLCSVPSLATPASPRDKWTASTSTPTVASSTTRFASTSKVDASVGTDEATSVGRRRSNAVGSRNRRPPRNATDSLAPISGWLIRGQRSVYPKHPIASLVDYPRCLLCFTKVVHKNIYSTFHRGQIVHKVLLT